MKKRHKTIQKREHDFIKNSIFTQLMFNYNMRCSSVLFLHLTVVILTTRDAGRLQAISGQERKQTLTRF